MTSLVFRAVAGVVNGAACAVNHLLETMYPREDIGAIWFDDELAAPADPHRAGVADPAAETVTPDLSAAGSPLTWEAWSIPAICEALGDHVPGMLSDGRIRCADEGGSVHEVCEDWIDWREHAAPDIARRIGCDPTRAALALTSLQTQ